MLAHWEQREDPGQPLDVAEDLTGLTMAIISETMFVARLDADTHAVSQAIDVLLADFNFRFQVPFYPYTRKVIDETLRLYPPAWITNRQAVAEDMVCGYTIPASAVVGISPYVMHHLSAYWPEPERFDPASTQRRR